MGYVRLQPGHDLPHLWCGCRRLQNRWLRPGPRGRTTASHWELSGSATRPECVAQPAASPRRAGPRRLE
jgi:hypothetical protein